VPADHLHLEIQQVTAMTAVRPRVDVPGASGVSRD
jgi:hypothetical protein